MEDSTIICKFLSRSYPDDHQAIYLYCCDGKRNTQTVINRILPITLKIFSPSLSENYIKSVIEEFLETKKKQYARGEIKVKPLYPNPQY